MESGMRYRTSTAVVVAGLVGAAAGLVGTLLWRQGVDSLSRCVESSEGFTCLPVPILLSRVGVAVVAGLAALLVCAITGLRPRAGVVFGLVAASVATIFAVAYALPVAVPRPHMQTFASLLVWLLPISFAAWFGLAVAAVKSPKQSTLLAIVAIPAVSAVVAAHLVRGPLEDAEHRREIQRAGITQYLPDPHAFRPEYTGLSYSDPLRSPAQPPSLTTDLLPAHTPRATDGQYVNNLRITTSRLTPKSWPPPCPAATRPPPCRQISQDRWAQTTWPMLVYQREGNELVVLSGQGWIDLPLSKILQAADTLRPAPPSTYLSTMTHSGT